MADQGMICTHHDHAQFDSSSIEKFIVSEETADVIIECENQAEFKCHRALLAASSGYFNIMFNGIFQRSYPKVVLRETSVDTFEAIMQFIYIGVDTVPINFSNICSLLRASEFFVIPVLQEKCIRFVKENILCVRSTFDLFRLAYTTMRNLPLVDVLSEDIVRQFRIFCRSDEFLELSFDELNVILYRWASKQPVREAELVFNSVTRWVNHDLPSRTRYGENVEKIPQFEDIISKRKMKRDRTAIVLPPVTLDFVIDDTVNDCMKPVGHNDVTETSREVAAVMSRKNVNVFVQCSGEDKTRVFALPLPNIIWNRRDVSGEISNVRVSNQNLRSVALDDDHLFCMHFPRHRSSATSTLNLNQSFCLYDSVNLRQPVELRNPPVIFEDVALCSFDTRIYAFNKSQRVRTSDSSSLFSDEAIKRGIFSYESCLDYWFPLPPMKREFYVNCATFMNGLLLMFGSEHPYEPNTIKSDIELRAYDPRSKHWLHIACESLCHSAATSCCVNGSKPNRLFLHTLPKCVLLFDLVAQRWESQTGKVVPLDRNVQYRRLIPFYDRIVAVGPSTANAEYPSYLATEDLWCHGNWDGEFLRSQWNISDELARTVERVSGKSTGIVLDAVVFKSY